MNMLPMQQTPREVEGFSPWKMALTCFNNLRICFAGVRFFPLSHLRYLFRYCILCAKKQTRNGFSLECRHMCNHVNTPVPGIDMTPKVLNWPKVGVQHARNVLLEPERASSGGEVRKFYQPIKQCLGDSWPQEKIMAGVLRHKNGRSTKSQ